MLTITTDSITSNLTPIQACRQPDTTWTLSWFPDPLSESSAHLAMNLTEEICGGEFDDSSQAVVLRLCQQLGVRPSDAVNSITAFMPDKEGAC